MAETRKEPADRRGAYNQQVAKLLNENHRRALSVTLRRVELAVWRLEERLAQEQFPQLALTRFTNPPDALQRTALLQLAKQIRTEVAQLAVDYHLEVGEENLLRTMMAEFSLLWCDLEDVRPEKLLRYGPVNPRAYAILDPPIQRLIKLVLLIDAVARGQQDVLRLWQQGDERHMEEPESRGDGEVC